MRIVWAVVTACLLAGLAGWLAGPAAFAPFVTGLAAILRPVAGTIVQLFNQPSVIYALSGLLMVFAAAFCAAYWLDVAVTERGRLSRLRRDVLALAPMDGPAGPSVARGLENLGDTLRVHGLFLSAYDDVIIARHAHGRLPEAPFTAGVQSRDWRRSGAQREFYAALPGYFTSIGLLLTFIGLVAALHFASRGFESGSAEQAKAAILQLLSASSFKFLTSVAALAGAILISVTVRLLDAGVRREAERTAVAIEDHLAGCRAVERRELARAAEGGAAGPVVALRSGA